MSEHAGAPMNEEDAGENSESTREVDYTPDIGPLPLDEIHEGDCRELLGRVADESIQLTITSPPYNIGKQYRDDDDDRKMGEWRELMRDVFEELFRLTAPDGKVCINVGFSTPDADETGRYYRIPLRSHIVSIAHDVGFDFYDEFVWLKNTFASHGSGTLFGSYPHPTNLMANQQHEYVLVFRKWVSEEYHEQRTIPPEGSPRRDRSELDIETWRKYTNSVWEIEPVSPDQLGVDHEAMFPVELPRRLVRMYSFVGDAVLDPFIGTGTTALAAREWDRHYLGFERQSGFVDIAHARLDGTLSREVETRNRANNALDNAEENGHTQHRLNQYDE